MLGIQVKSVATPRRRGPRTFGVVVMMLPMLGRGCLRSAACSCPGRRVLRPSGFETRPLSQVVCCTYKWPIFTAVCAFPDLVPVGILPMRVHISTLSLDLHVGRGGGGGASQDAARRRARQFGEAVGCCTHAVVCHACPRRLPIRFLSLVVSLAFDGSATRAQLTPPNPDLLSNLAGNYARPRDSRRRLQL